MTHTLANGKIVPQSLAKLGLVILAHDVRRDGSAHNPHVEFSTHPCFEANAKTAIAVWSAEPQEFETKNVAVKMHFVTSTENREELKLKSESFLQKVRDRNRQRQVYTFGLTTKTHRSPIYLAKNKEHNMRKISVSTIKAIFFSIVISIAYTQPANAQQKFSIQSESMQGTREIVVHLPMNYDADRQEGYSVIYMLNAGATDKMTAEIASFYHWGDLMPEVIVIGLKNVGRAPDFLPHYYSFERDGEQIFGNGRNLLTYIENELIPFANKQFNTNGDSVFAGHSWGGQFLTYAMSQSPGLFDAYFITSPAFGEAGKYSSKTFDALEQALKQDQDFPDFIYLSVGGDGSPGPLTDSVLLPEYYRLAALLRQHLPEEVRLHHEVHDNANHTSNSAISMAKALQLYFATRPEIE